MGVFTDAEGTFTGLMFQDNLMKSVFSSYPEVLLVAATYKLTNLRMPVYLMMSKSKVWLCRSCYDDYSQLS